MSAHCNGQALEQPTWDIGAGIISGYWHRTLEERTDLSRFRCTFSTQTLLRSYRYKIRMPLGDRKPAQPNLYYKMSKSNHGTTVRKYGRTS